MDLNEISQKFPDQEKVCKNYMLNEKTANLILGLENQTAMKLILEEQAKRVEGINSLLLYEENLSENCRNVLIKEREGCEYLKNKFTSARQILHKINEYKKKYD